MADVPDRGGDHISIPAWPRSMIAANASELARWRQLWSHPRAQVWDRVGLHTVVAELVRAEHRSHGRKPPSKFAEAEVRRLRGELGVSDD
jgi:hypothetical protein